MKYAVVGALVVLVIIALAFFAGRWTAPQAQVADPVALETVRQVVITKYVDRVVVRTKRVETKPDGSSVTEESEREEDHTTEKPPPPSEVLPLVTVAVTPKVSSWRVGLSAGASLTFDSVSGNVSAKMSYGVEMDRRLLGPVWAGVRFNTAPYVGVAVGVTF